MTNSQEVIASGIQKVRALALTSGDPDEYIISVIEKRLESLESESTLGVSSASISPQRQYVSARITAELLNNPEAVAARPEGIVDLSIIQWLLRPALLVADELFEQPSSGPWQNLPGQRICQLSRSVCRIDLQLTNHAPLHLGTGYLAGVNHGEQLVLTNKHVINEAIRLGWPEASELTVMCDFCCFEAASSVERRYAAQRRVQMHPHYDLAILSAEGISHHPDLPQTLAVGHPSSDNLSGLMIVVIGHPAYDSKRDIFPAYFGFGTALGVKRCSPGLIRAVCERKWLGSLVEVFLHDATTLSGSSGSCVVEVSTSRVIGLHFGGWPLPPIQISASSGNVIAQLFEANGAVPLWMLRDDQFMRNISFDTK